MKVLKIYCEQKLTDEQLQEIKESIGVDTDAEQKMRIILR